MKSEQEKGEADDSDLSGAGIKQLADSDIEENQEEIEAMEIVSGKKFLSNHSSSGESNSSFSLWVKGYQAVGFQGTNLYKAIEELKIMRRKGSKIFLGYTSNLISSGLRDIISYLVKNKYVDVLVTTAGGVEEDIIKTMKPSRLGEFTMDGATLRSHGMNRVGNIIIPNENYFVFEKWMTRFLNMIVDGDLTDTDASNVQGIGSGYRRAGDISIITPSRFIYELGKKIESKESVYYWAYMNNIPVYCPALTDGSIGDIITYFRRRRELVIDTVEDIVKINKEGLFCESTGALVLGAGIIKHHILNANLFRNGLDHCVLINTAQEYDGSDAGAQIDESVSWGKIKKHTKSVKVHADATIVLPIIVKAVWPKSK